MSQPMRRRARNWAESSTPSATVTSWRLWPRGMLRVPGPLAGLLASGGLVMLLGHGAAGAKPDGHHLARP